MRPCYFLVPSDNIEHRRKFQDKIQFILQVAAWFPDFLPQHRWNKRNMIYKANKQGFSTASLQNTWNSKFSGSFHVGFFSHIVCFPQPYFTAEGGCWQETLSQASIARLLYSSIVCELSLFICESQIIWILLLITWTRWETLMCARPLFMNTGHAWLCGAFTSLRPSLEVPWLEISYHFQILTYNTYSYIYISTWYIHIQAHKYT